MFWIAVNRLIWYRNIRYLNCNALHKLQFSKTKTYMDKGIIYCQVVRLKILVLLTNWSMRLLLFHNISSLSWRKMAVHLDLGFIALSNIIYITDIPNDLLSYMLTRKYLNPQKSAKVHWEESVKINTSLLIYFATNKHCWIKCFSSFWMVVPKKK